MDGCGYVALVDRSVRRRGMDMFGAPFRTLHFAVRPRVIAKYIGQILVAFAALTSVPAIVAFSTDSPEVAVRYLVVIGLLGGVGGICARVRCTERLQANEALVISSLAFLLPGLAMAFPLAGYGIAPLDAVFESISGVTTTGLSTLGSVANRSHGFLFTRAWLQWVGGLGVVVLALAFLIPTGAAAHRLGFDEMEDLHFIGGTRSHARRLIVVYAILTLAGFVLCVGVGLPLFEALVHVLSAVSTGGFSTSDSSLAVLTPAARSAVLLLCLVGATSFSLFDPLSWRSLIRDARLWTLLGTTGLVALLLSVLIEPSSNVQGMPRWAHAMWMAISAQTTAGFSTLPTADLPDAAKLVLIGSMWIGGDVGSTAGGIKIARFAVLAQLVVLRLLRASTSKRTHLAARLGGKRVSRQEIEAAAALALSSAGVVFVSWLAFLAYGSEPLDALFDVVSAVGTVGLSAGTTGPDLAPFLKGVLCMDMLLGRVEILAFVVLFFPGTWLGRRRSWENE